VQHLLEISGSSMGDTLSSLYMHLPLKVQFELIFVHECSINLT